MEREIFELEGVVLESILNDESKEFEVIDKRYDFLGCDHDLWEFQAIILRKLDGKFFKVNWYDNYSCNWHELGLDDEMFEFEETFRSIETRAIFS